MRQTIENIGRATTLLIAACTMASHALAQDTGPRSLNVTPGTSTVVNVSSRMVNELIVPYTNPKLVKFIRTDSTASINRDGSSIYVSTGTEEFIQLIIKNGDTPDQPGISLMLIPVEDVPPQHILLNPTGTAFVKPGGVVESKSSSEPHIDTLRELVRASAKDEISSGYTKDPTWSGTRMQVGTVVGEPAKRLVGNELAVEYFILKNIGATTVELVEPNFQQEGVLAIAFINGVKLAPGQVARMVWVRER